MKKIHVITQKELIDKKLLRNCTAVVIDVFLATSTISFLLQKNYEPIYAMEDVESAISFSDSLTEKHILLGEVKGKAIEGFLYPDPTLLKQTQEPISAVICSTNGTRAIRKGMEAENLYVSSLINGHLIAKRIHETNIESSIVLICSGSVNRFSMEDFVGAGQIVDHLMRLGSYELTDGSMVARDTYRHSHSISFKNLFDSQTASLLYNLGFESSMELIIENFEKVNVIPVLFGQKIINDY